MSEKAEYKDGLDLLIRGVRPRAEAVLQLKSEIAKESDRGCALLSAAYLENELRQLLADSFVAMSKTDADKIFEFNGPLGTFSARIRIAFAGAIISVGSKNALHLVRRIRNDFTHLETPLSFEEPMIAQRVLALLPEAGIGNHPPREMFILKVQSLFATLQAQRATTISPISPSHDLVPIGETVEEYEIELAAIKLMNTSGGQFDLDDARDVARRVKEIG